MCTLRLQNKNKRKNERKKEETNSRSIKSSPPLPANLAMSFISSQRKLVSNRHNLSRNTPNVKDQSLFDDNSLIQKENQNSNYESYYSQMPAKSKMSQLQQSHGTQRPKQDAQLESYLKTYSSRKHSHNSADQSREDLQEVPRTVHQASPTQLKGLPESAIPLPKYMQFIAQEHNRIWVAAYQSIDTLMVYSKSIKKSEFNAQTIQLYDQINQLRKTCQNKDIKFILEGLQEQVQSLEDSVRLFSENNNSLKIWKQIENDVQFIQKNF